MFLTCPRQYWFQYYGSWGGWDIGADPRCREIYILKQLKSRYMWAGERVHRAIERSLKNLATSSRPLAVDVEEIVRLTIEEMRLDFKSSRDGLYRSRPKTCALFEHEYQVPVSDEEWRSVAQTVERCLRQFYGSSIFEEIQSSDRSNWLECEQFSSFVVSGVKVQVVLDFVMRVGSEIVVYDWKTGASDEGDNRVQMACYAFYAHKKWGVAPEAVRPTEFNLNRGQVLSHSLTAADLERTRGYIEGSIADMRRLLRDPAANWAVEADFRQVSDERICRRCKYLKVCQPAVAVVPEADQNADASP